MKSAWRGRWTVTGVAIWVLAGVFDVTDSRGQTPPVTSVSKSVTPSSASVTNTLVKPTLSTNSVGPAVNSITNDATRVSSFPTRESSRRETVASHEAPGVFSKGMAIGVESRLNRYERMNGHKLFDFDGALARRRTDWFKTPGISPQYRWDVFQNGKSPPRAFRDGITSTYFD